MTRGFAPRMKCVSVNFRGSVELSDGYANRRAASAYICIRLRNSLSMTRALGCTRSWRNEHGRRRESETTTQARRRVVIGERAGLRIGRERGFHPAGVCQRNAAGVPDLQARALRSGSGQASHAGQRVRSSLTGGGRADRRQPTARAPAASRPRAVIRGR